MSVISSELLPNQMSRRIDLFVGTFSWLFMAALIIGIVAAMLG
jgi:hypothetical protein